MYIPLYMEAFAAAKENATATPTSHTLSSPWGTYCPSYGFTSHYSVRSSYRRKLRGTHLADVHQIDLGKSNHREKD